MDKRLKRAVLKVLNGQRPFEERKVILVECHGRKTVVREFKVRHNIGDHNNFYLEEIGDHVVPTLVFRRAKNGRLYPVKKKGS